MMNDKPSFGTLLTRMLLAGVIGLVAWYAIEMVYNLVIWQMTGGQQILGKYGRDKSLSNAAVEMPWALAIIFLSFVLARPMSNNKWLMKFIYISLPLLAVLCIIVPGLGE